MARALRILSVTLITAAVVILSDAALTIAWKEPISAIYASVRQHQAAGELDAVREDFLGLPAVAEIEERGSNPERRTRLLVALFADRLEEDQVIGRIEIPAIDGDHIVVEGTGTAGLRRGPGHYPGTALPGQGKTIGIAGHRTTYGAPFKAIDSIERGDPITLEMPYGSFTYEVTETKIVEPDEIEIVENVGRERLVLSACHPEYSAAQRYVVFADLKEASLDPR